MVRVNIKWAKESYNDVEVDTSQPPLVFKSQLYSLTGVLPDRQKIMVKGGLLKDDSDWDKVALKEGQKLMLMGTAEKVPEAPTSSMVFMEDLPEDEQDLSGLGKYGAGLKNLGNTCYMNSTLQCLYRVPELRWALRGYNGLSEGPAGLTSNKLTMAAKDLFALRTQDVTVLQQRLAYKDLERSADPVLPMRFLLQLRDRYPQFAQQSNTGQYMQQDAEECWTQLLYSLRESLKAEPEEGAAAAPLVQELLGVRLHTRLQCEDGNEEIVEDSTVFELKVNITIDVNHVTEGVKLGLQDDREKNSAQLGRLALYKGTSRMSRLPPYLTLQMVRFFYKRDVNQKSKILRKVSFPLVLDCYEFCTEEYQAELDGPRAAMKVVEDRKAGIEKVEKDKKRAAEQAAEAAKEAERAAKKGGKKREAESSARKPAEAAPAPVASSADVEMKDAGSTALAGPSSENGGASGEHAGKLTGKYDLMAVLTHKGRSADSGHYVAWAKQDDGQWVLFDDEEIHLKTAEEVLALSGGGDWHTAYLLLYAAQRVSQAV